VRDQAHRSFEHLTQTLSSFGSNLNFVFKAVTISQVNRHQAGVVLQTIKEVLSSFRLYIVTANTDMD
jgi:hypothetical protein